MTREKTIFVMSLQCTPYILSDTVFCYITVTGIVNNAGEEELKQEIIRSSVE